MFTTSITDSQDRVLHLPTTGKDKKGKPAKLEGPGVVVIDPDSDKAATVEIDPSDPTGLTVLIKATITDESGDGPWLVHGHFELDARVGPEVKTISELFAIEVTSGEGVTFGGGVTADAPTEQP